MGARSELSTAVDVLARNRVLFVAAFVSALVGSAGNAVQYLGPPALVGILSFAVSAVLLFVTPFVEGGLYGMAEEGLIGRTSFGTFLAEARANYLRLLAGRFLLVGVLIAVYVAVVLVVLLVLFGLGAVGMATGGVGDFGPAILVVVALLVVFLTLVVLTPLFLLQFYGPAIVVTDSGVVESFRRSYRLVRDNWVSVLGYDAVLVVLTLLGGLPYWVLFARRFGQFEPGMAATPFVGMSPALAVGYLVAGVLVAIPVAAFTSTYQIAFFVDQTADES